MRLPKIAHTFSRGFDAVKKTLGLATKGILDQKSGGGSPKRVIDIDVIIRLSGIKQFDLKLKYTLSGIIRTFIEKSINISGIKKYTQKYSYSISGILERDLALSLYGNGIKRFDFEQDSKLDGIKQFDLISESRLYGIKKFNTINEYQLIGTKQIELKKETTINAKKDITPILVALGLIGGENG